MAPVRKLISFDWAMKRLLRSKANFDILEGFLSELLFEDITVVEILESESNKESVRGKFNRLDLKCRNSKGEVILIEVQYDHEIDFLQRLLYGVSRAVTEHFKEGQKYSDIVKVYSIAIVYFDLGHGSDYIYHGTTVFKGLHKNEELTLSEIQKDFFRKEHPSQIFPEIYVIKVKNFDNVARNTLDEWIYFLKSGEIKDSFRARGLKKAKEKLDVLKMSEKERQQYQAYLDDLSYQASMVNSSYGVGRYEGREEGREEGKALSIIEMLQEGDISFVKARQKIDRLKSQNPDAAFWPGIYETLNRHNPSGVKEPAKKYRVTRNPPLKK